MKLLYNGVDLATLGVLRILSQATVKEPAEAAQRERVTLRCRLDFFQQTYAENAELVQSLWAGLKSATAVLLWQDESGATLAQRAVMAGDAELLEESGTRGGTRWQAVVFSFWTFLYDLPKQALAATLGGRDLGQVEKWSEGLDTTRWDEFRSARKRVAGEVTASGRLPADMSQ